MAHNFRVSGTYYVSKAGADANAGTDPNLPKATIGSTASLGSWPTIVIGEGYYVEAPNLQVNRTVRADGNVIIDGGSSALSTAYNIDWHKVTFKNFEGGTGQAGGAWTTFYDCTFINCNNIGINVYYKFVRCKFIDCSVPNPVWTECIVEDCVFINTSFKIRSMKSSLSYGSSVLNWFSATGADYSNNCLYGNLISSNSSAPTATIGVVQDVAANYYDLALTGTGGDGTQANPYTRDAARGPQFDFENYKVAFPSYVTASFKKDPLFNNLAKNDFTVKYNSPLIGKGVSGVNIGNVMFGSGFYADTTQAFDPAYGAVYTNTSLVGPNIVIADGFTSGTMTTAPILIGSDPKRIDKLNFLGNLSFNKSVAGGSPGNMNVPDAIVYGSADTTGGKTPDRLSVEVRWTTSPTKPAVDTDWNSGGFLPGGGYAKVTINERPLIDANARGNAEAAFDTASNQAIFATWIQIRITLTNAYN